jgi:glycosyltransferase involved in cell wall biosynthesis
LNTKLAIVICTRNRGSYLDQTLLSISKSASVPSLICVVSSGENVAQVVNRYAHLLNINHLHTEYSGQSLQKILAIKSLNKNIDWVFFLDDDLTLMRDTLDQVEKRILNQQHTNVYGIGCRLIPKEGNLRKIEFRIGNWVSLKKFGTIRKSGRAIKYMNDELSYPQWLNGASIWRIECLAEYKLPVIDSKYAAYEDVIFSSKIAQISKLVYDPEIKVVEQISHANINLSFLQFKYISLWTGYLVCSRPDTKIAGYKCLTIFRAVKFLLTGGFLKIVQERKFIDFLKFIKQMISLPMNKPKSKGIIIGLLEIESNES